MLELSTEAACPLIAHTGISSWASRPVDEGLCPGINAQPGQLLGNIWCDTLLEAVSLRERLEQEKFNDHFDPS